MPGWLLNLITSEFRLVLPGGLYLFIVWGSMLYAYRINDELPDDSPDKRQYSKLAILTAPFTLPVVIIAGVIAFIVYSISCAILFGVFLIIFPLMLLIFRNLGLIEWLLKRFERLGRALLKINTFLFYLAGLSPRQSS